MKKAYVVLGANYGDEGKGHITNFLSDENTLVVRFNGGSQAAHTVETEDGRSHVFRHFGSGTLRGARTLLGSHFLVNPLMFMKELEVLIKICPALREVLIDPTCRVSTPFDMLINEFNSHTKGKTDTCGVGINETVERSMFRDLRIVVRDLLDKSDTQLLKILKTIENEYVPWRAGKLGFDIKEFQKYGAERLAVNEMEQLFLRGSRWVVQRSAVWPEEQVVDRFLAKAPERQLVFEGAQGMLLDQARKEYFPHLTRSSTGMHNVVGLLRKVKTPMEVEVNLVTRAYLTRHGDGPMLEEVDAELYPAIEEPTNVENPYQGKMRYSALNLEWPEKARQEVSTAIAGLLTRNEAVEFGKTQFAVTCIDHVKDWNQKAPLETPVKVGKEIKKLSEIFSPVGIISMGRKDSDVRRMA